MAIIKLWITMHPLYKNYKLFLQLPLFILFFCCWYNVLFRTMWENRRVMISQKINYMKTENCEELNAHSGAFKNCFWKRCLLSSHSQRHFTFQNEQFIAYIFFFLEMIIKYYLYTNLRHGVAHKFKIRYRLYTIIAAFRGHLLK